MLIASGAIGGGLWWFGGPLRQVGDTAQIPSISGRNLSYERHFAEPFIPCSSNIIDCFSKANLAQRDGSRWGRGPGAGRGTLLPRGTRSRSIPGREPAIPVGTDPLEIAVSTPLTLFAEEIAPFIAGGGGSAAQSQRFDISVQNGAIGGIGGEVVAIPVPTPTPTPTSSPTSTPPVIETPVSPVPEPATWLQMLIGFAIVGTMLRWRRGRRGARQFS